MKALVCGGNGFIGSHLVDCLLANGDHVRALDRVHERYRLPLQSVEYQIASIGDIFVTAEALKDIDIVYHVASTTVPSTSNLDPVGDIENNLVNCVRLLDQMVKANVRRLVFLSSGGTVYGNPETTPVTEEHPVRPICSYGVVKVAIEHYLNMYKQLYGLSPIILRPANVYGPRQGHKGTQGILLALLAQAKNREPFTVWGDGSVVRDYLYVEDLVELCRVAGQSGNEGTFNAGSGCGHSIVEIIDIASKTLHQNIEVTLGEARAFDVRKFILDSSKAERAFGWVAKTSLQQGIVKMWDWLKKL